MCKVGDFMKVIIAGSRKFRKYSFVKEKLDKVFSNLDPNEIEIVSGTASGIDRLGERYAKEKGYQLTLFPCRWNLYGKSAGPYRNLEMAKYADALVAFYDGSSPGTTNMINTARKLNLKIRIIKIE